MTVSEEFELPELPAPAHPLPEAPESSREAHRRGRRAQRRQEKLDKLRDEADMKFSHSLQFNAVPDWSTHYIAYSNLKKL